MSEQTQAPNGFVFFQTEGGNGKSTGWGTDIVSDILHGSEILRADSKEMPEKSMYVLVAPMVLLMGSCQ